MIFYISNARVFSDKWAPIFCVSVSIGLQYVECVD